MTTYVNVGSDSNQPFDDAMSLYVQQGSTVTVTVSDGSTVNYYTTNNPYSESAADGTIANGANHSFTANAWITSQGHSTLQLTGGSY